MPEYVYQCLLCNHRQSVIMNINDYHDNHECVNLGCDGQLKRIYESPNIPEVKGAGRSPGRYAK